MKINFKYNLVVQIIILIVFLSTLYYIKILLQLSISEIIGQYFGYISILLIGLVLFFYYKTRREKENTKNAELYSHLATLLQTIFAIFAIWYAVNESKGNNEQFKTNLSKQDTLIGLQKSLIEKQDKTAELNLQALKTLADTSGKLVENVEKVNKLVAEMPGKIDGVSASFATLTDYAQREFDILQERELKKANIDINNISFIQVENNELGYSNIELINKGNIKGVIEKVIFSFEKDVFESVYSNASYDICNFSQTDNYYEFSFDLSNQDFHIAAYDKKTISTCSDTRFRLKQVEISSFVVNYFIIYSDINEGRYTKGTFPINLK